jgi:hypothetical protein
MLNPTRLRVYLGKFLLGARYDTCIVIIDYGAAAAGALVDSKQKFSFHDAFAFPLKIGCLTCMR